MNRTHKRIKIDIRSSNKNNNNNNNNSNNNINNGNNNGSSISSGNFMTSSLHDDPNEDVEMAIPSPDATNNEVTVNDINPDHEDIIIAPGKEIENVVRISEPSNKNLIIMNNVNGVPVEVRARYNTNNDIRKLIIANGGSISGGLTLDKTNKSLKNLIYYIKTAYSNNLTSPKWKNFKGLKLQVMEKIRLNNVIWRTWFEQYGIRDISKRKRPLVCQFANNLEEPSTPSHLAILEGKYWKRRLESITNEYKKWRELSRKQLKPSQDNLLQPDNIINEKEAFKSLKQNNLTHVSHATNINANNSNVSLHDLNINNSNNYYNIVNNANNIPQNQSINNISYNNSFNYYDSSNMGVVNELDNSHMNSNYIYNNNSSNANNSGYYVNQNIFNNNNNNNSNIASMTTTVTTSSSGSPTSSFTAVTNSNTNNQHYHHLPIASKQMPYNNRCRSPSPGLFQDFDLYNFSSDTLFSTYCFEDPKDPIFGTNPDLFQPDLMHLYPNFDFLELDDNLFSTNTSNTVSTQANNQSVNKPSSLISNTTSSPSTSRGGKNIRYTNRSSNTPNTIYPEQAGHVNVNVIPAPSKINSMLVVNQDQEAKQNCLTQPTTISIDYSDLSNFNTLVTVAAASPSISPRCATRNKLYTEPNDDNNSSSADVTSQIKLPVSLSQINSSINNSDAESSVQFSSTSNPAFNVPNRMINTINTSSSTSSSSNTIRNLLALNTSSLQTNNSNTNNANGATNQNSSSSIPRNNHSIGKNIFNNNNNNANANVNNNKYMPQQSVPIELPLGQSNLKKSKLKLNEAQPILPTQTNNNTNQLSALLTAVLAPTPIDLNNKNISSLAEQTSNSINDLHQDNSLNKPKRGRKSSLIKDTSILNEALNRSSSCNANLSTTTNISNSKYQNNKSIAISSRLNGALSQQNLAKQANSNKKETIKQLIPVDKVDLSSIEQVNYLKNILGVQYQQQQQQNMHKQFSQITDNSDSSVINSPINSPNNSNSSNNFSSNPNSYNNLHSQLSVNHSDNPSPIVHQQQQLNNSNFNSNGSYLSKLNGSSTINISSPSLKRNTTVNPSTSNGNEFSQANNSSTASRVMSRSNSVNSLNTVNDPAGLTTAEQKRRCNIQHGFDRLQTLVPSLRDGKNAKASKAAMLQKTSEYIKELQRAREKRMADLDVYRREIEALSDKISECQNQLPANGVSVMGNLNKTEQFEQKFNSYVKEKTVENWKFYLFSLILKPLFDNFVATLNTSSKEDMERTFYEWQQKYCNLTQLRPIASNALRQLSKSTSILSDSNKLPEECYSAALTRI